MKQQYRIRNWGDYNAALKQRGSLTFWVSPEVIEQWNETERTGKRGASNPYSSISILTLASLKALYRWGARQTQGFMELLFKLMKLTLSVPDHSTLSRRMKTLEVAIPILPKATARQIVIDSTGVKVYGEGEWKTRLHGASKRRTWRKLHLAMDEATGEILAVVASDNSTAL
jgi:hypothetical protein